MKRLISFFVIGEIILFGLCYHTGDMGAFTGHWIGLIIGSLLIIIGSLIISFKYNTKRRQNHENIPE
jgi:hypothetical protein